MITGNEISGGTYGIYCKSSYAMISGNRITHVKGDGIFLAGGAPTISGNVIEENDHNGIVCGSNAIISGNLIESNKDHGISNEGASAPTISGNIILGNDGHGISNTNTFATISGNMITKNGFCGIYNNLDYTAPTILYNKITDNNIAQLSGYADIYVADQYYEMAPKISFNVYDTITGTKGVGMYNMHSDGTPAPAP